MKKKFASNRTALFFLLMILMVSSCGRPELISLSISEDNNSVVLTLNDPALEADLAFKGGESAEGAIFFETPEGKSFIKGEPEELFNTADSFRAKWNIQEREVLVLFTRNEDQYNFSFSAAPDDDITGWGFQLGADENEYFTGVFERVVDGNQKESWKPGIQEAMNLRGQHIEMKIKYTLSLYSPFYISSRGYGLFIEGTWPGSYDFAKENPQLVRVNFEGSSMAGIIYTSNNPSEIVKAHALHTGPSIVPPAWAFRPYRWRDDNHNSGVYYDGTPEGTPFNTSVVEDILMMKAFDIPTSVYWIDRPWAEGPLGFDDYEWNREKFPYPEDMIKWLGEEGKNLLLWIAPWVDGNMADVARKNNYNLPFKNGKKTGWAEKNELALIDFSNPEAVDWWQTEGPAKVLEQGVKGFKLDRSEEIVPEKREMFYHNKKSAREMRNAYPVEYVKATNEICKEYYGDDFVIFPRAGYTGSSRYSVFWGGDIGSSQEGLRTAIIASQRASIMGYPLWGSDIGGYWQGRLDREVTARWLAFGCFNPVMEFGPTENRAPWDMESEPHYDTSLIATWRLYAKIHDNLADYSHELALEAHNSGMPVIRPLFLEYADQPEAWKDWQTFTYGPDILVSAIWEKGTSSHSCYLPAGHNWVDAWDEKVYEGGREIEIETPYHKIPIFIKEGSHIDLGDLNRLYEESLEIARNVPDLKELEKEVGVKKDEDLVGPGMRE